ncbi:MAG: NUDIX-like domain-containing protein, partial [Caulobacteraceae bacterium]|nr:NUDIX-like domain-containing protein [Caulobacteraceae bacterium]
MPQSAILNTFAGNPLDRASERRGDSDWLRQRFEDPESLVIAIWNGKPLLEDALKDDPTDASDKGVRIAYLPTGLARELAGGDEHTLFMGLWQETAVFAIDLEGEADPALGPLAGFGRFEDLRASAPRLPQADAGIIATAKAVFEWRRRHGFCAACGQVSRVTDGGWKRVCDACRTEHFPRTDPVVIMLPTLGDRCLLGRQAIWPKGMFSALAGF